MAPARAVPPRAAPSPRPGMVARISLGARATADSGSYFLLLGTTVFLVALGLVMVLSSSSVESVAAGRGFLGDFLTQGGAALIGLPLMLILSTLPARFWRWIATPALISSALLQLLVFTGLGTEYGGNRNWLDLGFVDVQPSEVTKVALVLWLGNVLASRQHLLGNGKRLLWLVVPVPGFVILLVLLGKDLGTVLIMAAMVFGALFFAGVRLRFLALGAGAATALALLMAQVSSSRVERIQAWLSGCQTDYLGACWQVQHGTWALAAGGFFGVGLGNSKAKWSWLPEADNDFIFAVIGEELGLLGAVVVLLLFVVLAVAFVRIVEGTTDPFARIVTSGIMVWVLVQAFVNIAVILGLLPVLGVPLPLISAGGTSLLTTLGALGIVLSFARSRPDDLRLGTGTGGVPAGRGARFGGPVAVGRTVRR
ncbi:putative lipid II flippase FtsW [Naasia sp.]|uniref:putative lipid II flippase FtsW n=1 Tax=Naasia sp. TaxID=2546198 RepID=UPI002615212D|nr:putative lipid II flippase FtsW [Naasia sp.]